MKYIDKFADWVLEQPLFEMAFYRKEAMHKIMSLSSPTFGHILKAKYINDKNNRNHWISEIKNFFNKVDEIEIKPFNRKFSKEEYIRWLFEGPYCDSNSSIKNNIYNFREEFIQKILNNINSDYKTDIKYKDIDFVEIVEFFKNICECIANGAPFEKVIDNFLISKRNENLNKILDCN